ELLSNATAHTICLQGHRIVKPAALTEATSRCSRRGWKAILPPLLSVKETSVAQVAQLSPRKPVRLQLCPGLSQLRALACRKPPLIPRDRPIGAGRAPPDWSSVADAADGRLGIVLAGKTPAARDMVDRACVQWANLAEEELCDLALATLPTL
ncbi:unnamed protein product, partial [Prorocentrum cordatum]